MRLVGTSRPDIIGRNGALLANDLRVASLYAELRRIPDVDEVVEDLSTALPEFHHEGTYHKLKGKAGLSGLNHN
ncbi:hypothetical protein NGM99_11775 [Mesorhizobium sp. RP14(2022)]|uniref:Uncharacterized protein n=1 Tax=Mesorhizobium liriopis TaxID=2953882 RepID=A0ABT1C8I3_9HYPH|nr:hypothetical protein [Mesorhizobium liriopis]MCO6050461.1 hypothetical protein [Mesorhizobium liriopis]